MLYYLLLLLLLFTFIFTLNEWMNDERTETKQKRLKNDDEVLPIFFYKVK